MPSLSKLVRSISSAASSRSSDKSLSLSYTDTYFDEIGFKLGEHSCLGSTESPDNLDGEEILFYKDDRLFYESDDDAEAGADEEEEEEEIEDYGSHYEVNTTTTPTTNRVEMTRQLRQELDHAHNYIMSIPLSKPHQQQQNSNSFSRGIQSYFAQLLRTDSLEYSPSASNHRSFHSASSNEKKNQKKRDLFPDLEISCTKSTLEESPTKEDVDRNDDESSTMGGGMISSKKKKTSFDDEEEEEEREFRTKATIKFLLLLGSFLLIVAAVVLLLAATQKNDNKKNAWNNTNNNNNNNDTTSLIPMSQGWDIDGNIAPFLDASSPTSTPPTVPPSISTTAPPLTDTQEELLTILASVSPTSKEFIRDHRESPQFQALDWLANDVNVDKYSMRRLVQRWVMATFYLSTNGDDWDTATTTTTATTTSNQTTRAGLKGPAGAEEGTAASWMSQTHECEWYTTHNQKIICDGQERLVVLSLGHRNLRGTLPTELGLLTTLKRLYLPDNHIDGSIPTDLALLTKLESIHISSNLITGQIPSELGQLSALGALKLHKNRISGTIPFQLSHLESLSTLKVNDNQIDGSIPVELFAVINLQTLALESNQLSGQVPTALVSLPFLTSLTLYNNLITGTMPFETCNLSVLIADCDELVCECCTECCIGCQGTVGKMMATVDTQAPTAGHTTSAPTENPSRRPSPSPTKGPTTAAPTTPGPTKTPIRSPTSAPTPSTPAPSTSMPTKIPTRNPTNAPTPSTNTPSTSMPTKIPTRNPTNAPIPAPSTNAPSTSVPTKKATTLLPTVSSTDSPSSKPISSAPVPSPTQAPVPTQIFILITVGNDGSPESAFPLKMCQGDCDRNNQCEGDLVCYQRYDDRPVPGCRGIGTSGRDYCTHPSFIPDITPYPTNQPTISAADIPSRCMLSADKSCYRTDTDDIILFFQGCDVMENVWIGFFPVGLFFGEFFNTSPHDTTLTKNAADFWFPTTGPDGQVSLPSAASLPSGDYIIYLVNDIDQSNSVSGGQIAINYSC